MGGWPSETARHCSYIANGCAFQCAFGGRTEDEALDIVAGNGLRESTEDLHTYDLLPPSQILPRVRSEIVLSITTCAAVLDPARTEPEIGNVRAYARYLITHVS